MSNSEIIPNRVIARTLHTERLAIIPLHHTQANSLCDYHTVNAEFHRPTAPTPVDDFYSEEYWQRRIWEARQNWEKQKTALFVLVKASSLDSSNHTIIGSINFNQIIRGALQSCFLGYSMDRDHQAHGFMTEALNELVDYIFTEWKLHRIQANYLVDNLASARVLEKLGFEKEGLAKNYLKINGSWQDHILTAKINSDYSL